MSLLIPAYKKQDLEFAIFLRNANEKEQANHAREYTVAYFNKDIDELNWCASESYNLIKKHYKLKHWQYE